MRLWLQNEDTVYDCARFADAKHPALRSRLIWLVVQDVGASDVVATTVSVSQQVSSLQREARPALVATAQVFRRSGQGCHRREETARGFQRCAHRREVDIQKGEIRHSQTAATLAVAGRRVASRRERSLSIPIRRSRSRRSTRSGTIQVRVAARRRRASG